LFPARGEASQLRLHKIRLVHRLREVIAGLGIAGLGIAGLGIAGLGIAGLGIAAGVATTNGVLLINTRLPRISMHLDLSDDETLALLNLLTKTIEADRYRFSPRIRTLRGILAKFGPMGPPPPPPPPARPPTLEERDPSRRPRSRSRRVR
jgi:hypothetical protein